MTLQKFTIQKDQKGFTLVEPMIVVAIIGILAAIAIPQFAAYRTRSYNASAKGLNKIAAGAQADLNAELGAYGWTLNTIAGNDLAEFVSAGGFPGAGLDAVSSANNTAWATAATATVAGGRICGNNGLSAKQFSIPFGLGAGMIFATNTPANAVGVNNAISYVTYARHLHGDTAYGTDSDSASALYSVSNPNWPGVTAAGALMQATLLAPINAADDINGIAGGGAPTGTWELVQ